MYVQYISMKALSVCMHVRTVCMKTISYVCMYVNLSMVYVCVKNRKSGKRTRFSPMTTCGPAMTAAARARSRRGRRWTRPPCSR